MKLIVEQWKKDGQWYVCTEDGGDTFHLGPFRSEQAAFDYQKRHGIMVAPGVLPQPTCPICILTHTPNAARCPDHQTSRFSAREAVLNEVSSERDWQDDKWGGPGHDERHNRIDWVGFIEDHAAAAVADAPVGMDVSARYRHEMIQVAALAVAAVESHDRITKRPLK